jgi:O-antigen ligase
LVVAVCGAIMIFAPLAYGAVHPWAYFSIGLALSVLSLGVLVNCLYKIWATPAENLILPYPILWWLGFGLVVLAATQLLPWPQEIVRWLSPTALEIRSLGNGYALGDYLPLSLNPQETLLEFLKLWPAVLIFFMLIYTINSRRQIRFLVWLILMVALFEVLYGFWNFRTHIIWGWKNPYTGTRLCGTFINCNHLAFLLTMAILLGFGFFMAQIRVTSHLGENSSGWHRVREISRADYLEPQFKGFLILFLLLLLVVGLIFTGSRGGMISLVAGFSLMAMLIWIRRWRKGHIILLVSFLAISLLYSLFLGSGQLLSRFHDITDEQRYFAMKGAVNLFTEFPWIGSGIGTFGELFYQFEPAGLHGKYFIYTHNDWLQALAETGLCGFVFLLAAWLTLFTLLVREWRQCQDRFGRYVALGGIAALGAGIFHSLAEFPFHIPALSLVYAGVAAISYLSVYSRRQDYWEYFAYPSIKIPGRSSFFSLILISLILVQLAIAGQLWYQWEAERIAPTAINSTCSPPDLGVKDFQRALVLNPKNSRYSLGLAEAWGKNPPENVWPEVEKALRASVRNAPAFWGYRLKLAEFYLRRFEIAPRRYIPAALKELEAAVTLFPSSGALHLRLATALTWAGQYYSGLIPPGLCEQSDYHYRQALKLAPNLKKFINKR